MNDIFRSVAFLSVLAVAIQSCTPPPPPDFEQEFQVRGIDLRKYADQDFLITPSSYGGDFVTVAFITVDALNGAIWVEKEEKPTSPYDSPYYWKRLPVTLEQVIDSTVVAAKDLGADGLIELEIFRDNKLQEHGIRGGKIQQLGPRAFYRGRIELKAWAIRRKIQP